MTEEKLKGVLANFWTFEDCCEYHEPTHINEGGSVVINPKFVNYCASKGYIKENN